jgi:hypothetical protein
VFVVASDKKFNDTTIYSLLVIWIGSYPNTWEGDIHPVQPDWEVVEILNLRIEGLGWDSIGLAQS